MPPRASIVIPTYRRPQAAVRAVRSALNQSLSEIEVIVVDDGSGDETVDLLREIDDARLAVLEQERNRGVCAARNRGILAARAPFVALLDSDDELLPDAIEQRIERLEAAPEAPAAYCRVFYRLSPKLELICPKTPLHPGDSFIESLILRKGLQTSALMARAEALRQCPFDERLQGFDDWDVALKLSRLGPIAFVEQPLVIVHAEDETEGERVTFSFDPERELKLLEMHRDLFAQAPRAEAALLYRLAMRAIRGRRKDLALPWLERTVALDPGHRKARVMRRLVRLGLAPLLPPLLTLRWKLMRMTGRVESHS